MGYVEVIAQARVRPGQLEGFKARAEAIVRATRQQDTHTIRCDWFLSEDGTECEIHEMFPDEQGLIEHQMHIMEARTVLFRDFATDHRSTIFGEVSQNFLELVKMRMGAAPRVFSFLQGLDKSNRATTSPTGEGLQVHAHLKIRPGQLEGFKAQAAEILRLTREQDTQTVRYDWFISNDGTECEVHEAYSNEQALVEHNRHVVDARTILFERYAYDHRMTAFGDVSPELKELANKHAGGLKVYAFMQGFHAAAAA
jgi:quinol monooxygenase YgiN